MTFSRRPLKKAGADLKPVGEVVSDRVWRAMIDTSSLLSELGIGHALVGGLAVGAHGWPRATKDVDFLVDATLSIRDDERHLQSAIDNAETSEGVPVAPVEAIVYMKLASPRSKDRMDVIELIRAGLDVEKVRQYIDRVAPQLSDRFAEAVKTAVSEEDE